MTQGEMKALIKKLARRRYLYVRQLPKLMCYPALYREKIQDINNAIKELDEEISRYLEKIQHAPTY